MRPDIASCGRAIYDMGFPWGIVTNGMLLDRRRFDSLLKAGIHSATISVDGFEADHDWMRGVPGSFRKATEGVRMFTEVDDVIFDVVTCANRRNLASLPEFKEFLISLGLKRWRIFTVFPSGRAAGDPEMQLSPEQFDSLMEFIMETRKEGRIHLNYGCENFLGGYEGLVRDNFFSCSAGLSCSSILANGDIAACASIRSDYAQGNIYRGDDFIDVWENRYQVFRDRSWMRERGDECGRCKYFRYCLGGSMHLRESDGSLRPGTCRMLQ